MRSGYPSRGSTRKSAASRLGTFLRIRSMDTSEFRIIGDSNWILMSNSEFLLYISFYADKARLAFLDSGREELPSVARLSRHRATHPYHA